mgnify:CR=1 FL=1
MISIMVPALNEEGPLKDVVLEIIKVSSLNDINVEIIIVNDGSTDSTGKIAEKLKSDYSSVKVIHNSRNLGLGKCFEKVIISAQGDKLLTVPGDGDMSSIDLALMLNNAYKADMVFLYFLNKEMRGRFRNVLSTLYNSLFFIFFSIYVQYINGPCVLPIKKLRELDLYSDRFSIAAEMAVKLLHSGCTYYEISGYMQKGADGSTAVSFKNLFEVCTSFIRLVVEIKLTGRNKYNKPPERIQ